MAVALFTFMSANAVSSTAKPAPEKKAIVLAVFGTTYPKAIQSVLNLNEKIIRAFPNVDVKLAFTSKIIRNKWSKRAKDLKWRKAHPEILDMVYTAKNTLATIADLQNQGYGHIAVQSTHVFAGEEYGNLKSEINALDAIKALRDRDKPFKKLLLGRPALGAPSDVFHYTEDIKHAAHVLKKDVDLAAKNRSALVYMGHGNEILSTGAYVELEAVLRDANPDVPVFIGNVEGFPGLDRVLKGLSHAKVKTVTLMPLMVVAGDHASNDMAGDEEDSWKTQLESKGIKVIPVLRGLGEVDAWADIYVNHLKEVMAAHDF